MTREGTVTTTAARTVRSAPLSREERWDRLRDLARAVVELAWRDARPGTNAPSDISTEAREFLMSEAAVFWTSTAGVDLLRLRMLLKQDPSRSENVGLPFLQ